MNQAVAAWSRDEQKIGLYCNCGSFLAKTCVGVGLWVSFFQNWGKIGVGVVVGVFLKLWDGASKGRMVDLSVENVDNF